MPTHDSYFGAPFGVLVPAGATPTPVRLATLSDLTVKITKDQKPLEGEDLVAKDMGTAALKFVISAKVAEWRADALAAFLAGTLTTGRLATAKDVVQVIPGTPFQFTAAQVTGFVDLGVRDYTTGRPMKRVAAAPATGQYMVTTGGQYTFAAADTGKSVAYSQAYSKATADKVTFANRAAQIDTPLALFMGKEDPAVAGKGFVMKFLAVYLRDFGFGWKSKDWQGFDVEMDAIADGSGNVFEVGQE